jgi:hypothetical protein
MVFLRPILAFGGLALVIGAILYATDERPIEQPEEPEPGPGPEPVSDKQTDEEPAPPMPTYTPDPAPTVVEEESPSGELSAEFITKNAAAAPEPVAAPELTLTPSAPIYEA